MLKLSYVKKYNEEFFTNLFDVTNKIEIKEVRVELHELLSNEDVKNICAKIKDKITRSIFSKNVSCFI